MAVARGAKRSEERAAVEGVSEEGSGELRRSVMEAQGARRRERQARGSGRGALLAHGCHALSLWGISQSTWQATTWPH